MSITVFGVLHDKVGVEPFEKMVSNTGFIPDVVFLEQSDSPEGYINHYLLEQGGDFLSSVSRLFGKVAIYGIDGTLSPKNGEINEIKAGLDYADEEIQDAVHNLLDGFDIVSDEYLDQSDLRESIFTYEEICNSRELRMARQIENYKNDNKVNDCLVIVGSYHSSAVVRHLKSNNIGADLVLATTQWDDAINGLVDAVRRPGKTTTSLRSYLAVAALNRLGIENLLANKPFPNGIERIKYNHELYATRLYHETVRRAEGSNLEISDFLNLAVELA